MPVLVGTRSNERKGGAANVRFSVTLNAQQIGLMSNLSGGVVPRGGALRRDLPATMLEPVEFNDTPDERLHDTRLIPVDESEDSW
jgi:hypothetical protein